LLTGASGYLGQFLLESFLKDSLSSSPSNDEEIEYHIHAIHHSNPGLEEAVEKLREHYLHQPSSSSPSSAPVRSRIAVQVDALDLGDAPSVVEFLKNNPVDVCVHAAAISSPRSCAENPESARAVNVPEHLVDAFFDQPHSSAKTMIAVSTDQVYGGMKGSPYVEADDTNPPNVYGQTKVELERYLLSAAAAKEGVHSGQCRRVYLLRCSLIFGPLAPLSSLGVTTRDTFLHFIRSRAEQGTPTEYYTDEKRSVVSVRDVVSVLRWLVDDHSNDDDEKAAGKSGVYNVGGPVALSRYEMAVAVFQHLGYKADGTVRPVQKSQLDPPPPIATPMNTDMDSSKIRNLTGLEFADLRGILVDTFGPPTAGGQCSS